MGKYLLCDCSGLYDPVMYFFSTTFLWKHRIFKHSLWRKAALCLIHLLSPLLFAVKVSTKTIGHSIVTEDAI